MATAKETEELLKVSAAAAQESLTAKLAENIAAMDSAKILALEAQAVQLQAAAAVQLEAALEDQRNRMAREHARTTEMLLLSQAQADAAVATQRAQTLELATKKNGESIESSSSSPSSPSRESVSSSFPYSSIGSYSLPPLPLSPTFASESPTLSAVIAAADAAAVQQDLEEEIRALREEILCIDVVDDNDPSKRDEEKVNNDDDSDDIIDEFNNNKEAKTNDTFFSDDTTNQKYDSSDESEKKGTFRSATVSSAQSPRQKVIAAMRDPLFILGAMCILVIGLVGGNHERIATFFAGIRKQNISADSLSNHSTSPKSDPSDPIGEESASEPDLPGAQG